MNNRYICLSIPTSLKIILIKIKLFSIRWSDVLELEANPGDGSVHPSDNSLAIVENAGISILDAVFTDGTVRSRKTLTRAC